MNTLLHSQAEAECVTLALVRASCTFTLAPLPDDHWMIEFRGEEKCRRAVTRGIMAAAEPGGDAA